MSASVVGIEKPVVIDRKQNLREHRLYWVGRRMQDVVLSALALVVLSPVMLATAIAIVVDDPSAGPIFSQERIGRDGKPFRLSISHIRSDRKLLRITRIFWIRECI